MYSDKLGSHASGKCKKEGSEIWAFFLGIHIAYRLPRLLLEEELLELDERLVVLLLRVVDVDALDERLVVVPALEERVDDVALLFRVAGLVVEVRFLRLMLGDCLLPESSR